MNLVDLLNSDEAELPITAKINLEEQLSDCFNAYISKAKILSSEDTATKLLLSSLDKVAQLAESIVKALGHWLNAEPELALEKLDVSLEQMETQIHRLTSNEIGGTDIGPLFRTRVAQFGTRFSTGQMFHIPFEKRDKVATQRYSFPGLPCLYLGRSIYGCWEEMGRPDLHSLWISKFEISPEQTIRVLDFGHRPKRWARMLRDINNAPQMPLKAAAFAILWPLIAGCSVKRRPNSAKSFVVEYVVPQLLLRWLVRRMRSSSCPPNSIIDGIRYFSTHIDDHAVDLAGINYIFPSQSRQEEGYCPELRSEEKIITDFTLGRSCSSTLGASRVSRNLAVAFAGRIS